MKTRKFIFVILPLAFMTFSCNKSDQDIKKVDDADLDVTVEGATQISSGVQSFIFSTIAVAADSGFYTQVPDASLKKKAVHQKSSFDYSWSGPDADGWYTRRMSGTYEYYERVRFRDTIDYIMKISYSGADGTYENTTTTHYIKYTKNQKVLYKGYSEWDLYESGYSNISRVKWKITFEDWNPASGAGTYDWYWGVSENSGGYTVPYHRFEHLSVTEKNNSWLHCRVIFYDEGSTELWDFEYDTPWVSVDMPDIPDID